jgi:hypothetical protein
MEATRKCRRACDDTRKKTCSREVGCEDLAWIYLALERNNFGAIVNTIIGIQFP